MVEPLRMTIGELAKRTGVTPRTIRFYVAEGLLPQGTVSGRLRLYGPEHEYRLRLIKLLQDEDLPLKRIKARLDALSEAEIRKYVSLGEEIKAREAREGPANPRQELQFMFSPPSPQARLRFQLRSERPLMLRSVLRESSADNLSARAAGLWRKVPIAPGIELLYEVTDDAKRMAKIQQIVQYAVKTLSNGPDSGQTDNEEAIR